MRVLTLDMNVYLLYGHKRLTGNSNTRSSHTPLHPGLECRIFRMSRRKLKYEKNATRTSHQNKQNGGLADRVVEFSNPNDQEL